MQFRDLLPEGRKPGYMELSSLFSAAILDGRVPPNSPLPPTRVMAEILGVSRDTVVRCYRHLAHLAFVETDGTRGTFVRAVAFGKGDEPESANEHLDEKRLSAYAQNLGSLQAHRTAPDLPVINYGAVPTSALPSRRWKELFRTRLQPATSRNPQYDLEVLGRPELRRALADYVSRTKEIRCTADEVVVFNISFTAYALISRLLLNPGDLFAVEEPGYGGIKNAASYHNFKVIPIPVDEHGLVVDALEASSEPIKLVYVSADHQEPTGRIMTLSRRKQLIDWAKQTGAWIIDDDYDGFFHYGKKLPPSLKSLDDGNHVIYFGTFWQILYPLTTVCFAALPSKLMKTVVQAKIETEGITEAMLQLALADMLDTGFLQKHARRLERQFQPKLRSLIANLKLAFGNKISIAGSSGGITLLVQFDGFTERAILEAAKTAGISMMSTSCYYHGQGKTGEFVVYFPSLGDEREVKGQVKMFASLLYTSIRERSARQN